MISVFGPRAEMYTYGLAGIEAAVIADYEHITHAYVAAVRYRETGAPFYGMLLYEDLRSHSILVNAAGVAAQVADIDQRRGTLELFCKGELRVTGGKLSRELWAEPDAIARQTIGEFCALSDALLVRSYAEYVRISALLKRPRRFEPVVAEPALPAFVRTASSRPSVVIWAPERPTWYVALYVIALMEFLGDITVVTGDGAPLPGYPGRFMRVGPEAVESLSSACCVLCADPDDPGAAVAFARRGLGVVAPMSSGAHEFVRDVVTFDIGSFQSILTAVQIAVAQPASLRPLPEPPPQPSRPALPAAESYPLVSVVLVTYNRRDDVTRALECIAKQTYPNVEVVVVNDAGENVDDVIARFPNARPLNLPVNGGVLKAIRAGLDEARGEYVQILADDDWLAPDHVEALVGAMLRTGGSIAHGNTLIRYQKLVPGAEPRTIGYNAVVFNESVTPSEALIATPIAGHSLIFRRDVLDEIGTWREDCILADQEFQMRAAGRYVLVYVDRMVAEWRARGSTNLSATTDSSIEMRRVFEELHPVEGRPYLQKRRGDALRTVAERTPGVFAFPATIETGS